MAALDFPDNPFTGQVFDRWVYDGSKWVMGGGSDPQPGIDLMGGTSHMIPTLDVFKTIPWTTVNSNRGLMYASDGTITIPQGSGGVYVYALQLSWWENTAWGGAGTIEAGVSINGQPNTWPSHKHRQPFTNETTTRLSMGGAINLNGGDAVRTYIGLNSGSQPALAWTPAENGFTLNRVSASGS